MFDRLALDDDLPEPDLSSARMDVLLTEIKRNSRNRRIAMFGPVILAAAVLGAMVAAPPRHGGLTEVADAEAADPQMPRVFGANGVWRLAEPIQQDPQSTPGPADMIQAPTIPDGPEFTLSPPQPEELHSLPTSTSTPPTSTSGQNPDSGSPADLDWSDFTAVIRIENDGNSSSTPEETPTHDTPSVDGVPSSDGNVTVAEDPQYESPTNPPVVNPSTPRVGPEDDTPLFSAPATIVPTSVPLVTGAHVSVTVQVVDDDSSVIDWCNTRVDWGDGSVTRVAGAADADLCTASCEYESTSSVAGPFASDDDPTGDRFGGAVDGALESATGIDEIIEFEHQYSVTVDVAPRIFVATGDGCSYTLAELQLPPFTVVPLN